MFSKERERKGEGYKRRADSWSGNTEVMRGTNTHTHAHSEIKWVVTEPMELSTYMK